MTTPKKGSGEHPAVAQFRAKVASFDETTMPMLERLAERVGVGSNPPEGTQPGSRRPEQAAVVVLTIHTDGQHRARFAADASRLAASLVDELRAAGHVVTFASIAHGGETIVIDQGPHGGPSP